jgi:hypothetical protein
MSIEPGQLLRSALITYDKQRPRSQQKALGPSSIYDCPRRVWHASHDTQITNHTEGLSAILGTAIHTLIAEAIQLEDPFGDDFLIETTVEGLGRKGHCDLFIKSAGMVIDWKTINKNGLSKFPDQPKVMQVQAYGVLMEEMGYEVKEVCLVAICRDGAMKDIKSWRAPYDREVGLTGLKWLETIENMDLPPAGTQRLSFCTNYCQFYDATGAVGCPGTR